MDERTEANNLYFVTDKIASMALEMATPDGDHDYTSDTFDELYAYVDQQKDAEDTASESLIFRSGDGRGISIAVVMIQVDRGDML